jgi:hypothetical protein
MDLQMRSSGQLGSDSDLGSHLEGDIVVPDKAGTDNVTSHEDFQTLDEPIITTIRRDLSSMGQKLMYALMPNSSKNLLMTDWDWWAHLVFSTYIGIMLQDSGTGNQFTQVFLLAWIGTGIITYNFAFSTANISAFQCVSVLGYCLGPLAIVVTLFRLIQLLQISNSIIFIYLILSAGAAAWASLASTKILGSTIQMEKKIMLLGPIMIFYTCIAILILYHSY